MEQKAPARADVIMCGIGGRGVLMAGLLLARAGLQKYKYASWSPTYAGAMRGGLCECTVVLSDGEIVSPVVSQADAVIVIDPMVAMPFEGRVKPGGVLVVEAFGLTHEFKRSDIRVLKVPGLEMAQQLGNAQVANFILLGTYLEATKAVELQRIEEELERRLKGGRGEALLSFNKRALREGAKLAGQGRNT